MSTRANVIAKIGNIHKMIYCHFDGYISGLGQTLEFNYNTQELIEELISMGNASSINSTIDDSVFYFRDYNRDWEIEKPEIINFDSFINQMLIKKYNHTLFIDFCYYWDGEQWLVTKSFKDFDVLKECLN